MSYDYWTTPEPQPIAAPGTKDCNYPRHLLPSIRVAKLHGGVTKIPRPIPPLNWLNVYQVAELFNYSRGGIRTLIKNGDLVTHDFKGRAYLIKDEVAQYMATAQRRQTARVKG